MPATTRDPDLTPRQIAILAGLGASLWLGAALLLRALAPFGIHEGMAQVALFVLIVPGTWPFVLLLVRVAGIGRPQALGGVTVALTVAMLLDGIALAWLPWLYGTTVAHTAGAGAAILWGAGVFLVLGAVAARTGGEAG